MNPPQDEEKKGFFGGLVDSISDAFDKLKAAMLKTEKEEKENTEYQDEFHKNEEEVEKHAEKELADMMEQSK